MAPKTTLNAKNLEALGVERLAALLIEISTGSAASKRRLRLELAGAQSTAEVAREVRKRLSSIERSRTIINWRKIKALHKDLETQRAVIVETIAPGDPDEALELLWRFLDLANSIFARCDDGNGTIIACFHAACADLGAIAPIAARTKRLPEQTFAALQRNEYGQCDTLIEALAPALGRDGLTQLKSLLQEWAYEPVETPENRVIIGYGSHGPLYEDEVHDRHRDMACRTALEQIADALGDVDAYMAQQSEQSRSVPSVAADIARRLLKAGRPEEALAAIDMAKTIGARSSADFNWQDTRCMVLEEIGRQQEAQDFRWRCFEQSLSAGHLKAYLKRLPDFDDIEAEEKAFDFLAKAEDIHAALHFLATWPSLAHAAKLVVARAEDIDGDHYELLTEMAETLQEKHPLAATILLRAMIDFALENARASRYRHAARHLAECALLAAHIVDYGTLPDHAAYVAGLRRNHGKKHGFWNAIG